MILMVNAENTYIFIGCSDEAEGSLIFSDKISTDFTKTSVEYAILIKHLLKFYNIDPENLTGGVIASCVPTVTDALKSTVRQLIHRDVIEVGPGVRSGVDIRLDDPGELGADLIVTAAAGIAEYGAPLIIISLNTLTTFSVINEQKHFIGAVFMPGIRLSAAAMSTNSACLPDTAVRKSSRLIGPNTAESMQSGLFYGTAAAIDGMVDRIGRELGSESIVPVITGEFAQTVAGLCTRQMRVDENLGMKGLISIYNRNNKNNKKKAK